ncbi:hypothetical protein LLB_3216 [Legionella longbeachae D-4968]|nr:hypothetical protein LLB_3216 [Legionella longbeachae D-4968]
MSTIGCCQIQAQCSEPSHYLDGKISGFDKKMFIVSLYF